MPPPKFEEALAALERKGRVKKVSNYYEAQCPAHGGKGWNLHLIEGEDGSAALRCHSHQCDYWDILAAIGLGKEREAPPTLAPPPSKPVDLVEVARYRIPMLDGGYVEHARLEGRDGQKEFRWYRDGKLGLGGFPAADIPLYGWDQLRDGPAVLTEGEKACVAVIEAGINAAATTTGANNTPSGTALAPLLGRSVYLWADNDGLGRDHMGRIHQLLTALGHTEVRTVEWAGAPAKGDAHDAMAAGIDIQALLDAAESPADKARKRLGLALPKNWLHIEEEEVEWLIDGLIPSAALTMMAAYIKVGKSVFMRHAATAIAKGERFLGREVTQGPVIYLAMEEPPPLVRGNFRRLGVSDEDPLYLMTSHSYEEIVEHLTYEAERIKPVAIFIDTLIKMPHRPREMNDYPAWTAWMETWLKFAHGSGIAIITSYHASRAMRRVSAGDSQAAIMGSTGIGASNDQLIFLQKDLDETRSFNVSGRYRDIPSTLVSLDPDTQRLSVIGTADEVTLVQVRNVIIETLDADEWMALATVKQEVPHAATDVNKGLDGLVADGLIERIGEGKKGSPYKYRRKEIPFPIPPLGTEQEMESETVEEEAVWQSL